MRYRGRERRIRTSFVTRNREYHVTAGYVVAVRDCKTSVWISGHRAIGMRLKPLPKGIGYVGRCLEFYCSERQELLQTSPVVDIFRPNRSLVDSYGIVRGFIPRDDDEEQVG